MRLFGYVLGVFAVVFVLTNTTATALELERSDSLSIQAIVLPSRSIYVDSNLKIVKIFSNTVGDAQPKAYLDSSPSQEIQVDQGIYDQYLQIKSHYNLAKVGQVYTYLEPKAQTSAASKPSFLFTLASRFKLNVLQLKLAFASRIGYG